MIPVIKLGQLFDVATLLKEYLSLQLDNILPNKYSRTEVFNGEFRLEQCPYLKQVCEEVADIGLKYNFALFRLMQPQTTLGWHKDDDCDHVSYHIPIITNHACFYVYDHELFPMQEVGELYSVRVDEMHTFINAGTSPRLHLHFIQDNAGRYLSREFAG